MSHVGSGSRPYASLAMYPFEPLRTRWEALWSAVHDLAPWTPESLRWTGDMHHHWIDPECRVAQACGWPVATTLRGRVEVVGAFSLALDGADAHRYRSVLLANRPAPLDDIVGATTVAAANGPDSLSGWISLLAATVGPDAGWAGPVRWTGSHVESIRVLQRGGADIVSIDALTLAYVRRHEPDLVAGLHEVGFGPWVPSLPVVVPAGTSAGAVEELRAAFAGALTQTDLGGVRDALSLDGFVALDDRAYHPLVELVRNANVGTFVPEIPGTQPDS